MTRRRVYLGAGLIVAILAAWGGRFWLLYPNPPDAATADLRECMDFSAGTEFNRMFERHRKQYVQAVLARLARQPLGDLLKLMLENPGPQSRISRMQRNIRMLEGHGAIESGFYAQLLERVYQMSPLARRTLILAVAVASDQRLKSDPNFAFLPSRQEFDKQFSEFMRDLKPGHQALITQFIMDVQAQRAAMGMKDPFTAK
jgi:hypothetical protein